MHHTVVDTVVPATCSEEEKCSGVFTNVQIILTKGRIAGADFSRREGQCNVTRTIALQSDVMTLLIFCSVQPSSD